MKLNITKVFIFGYKVIVLGFAAFLFISVWIALASHFGLLGHLIAPFIGYFAAYVWLSIIGYKINNEE